MLTPTRPEGEHGDNGRGERRRPAESTICKPFAKKAPNQVRGGLKQCKISLSGRNSRSLPQLRYSARPPRSYWRSSLRCWRVGPARPMRPRHSSSSELTWPGSFGGGGLGGEQRPLCPQAKSCVARAPTPLPSVRRRRRARHDGYLRALASTSLRKLACDTPPCSSSLPREDTEARWVRHTLIYATRY